MIPRSFSWRTYSKDRIFVFLVALAIVCVVAVLIERRPSLERTPIPFQLGLFFTVVNGVFAVVTLKREPLLSYMFLTATVLLNGSLYFFFRYLLLIQGS